MVEDLCNCPNLQRQSSNRLSGGETCTPTSGTKPDLHYFLRASPAALPRSGRSLEHLQGKNADYADLYLREVASDTSCRRYCDGGTRSGKLQQAFIMKVSDICQPCMGHDPSIEPHVQIQ